MGEIRVALESVCYNFSNQSLVSDYRDSLVSPLTKQDFSLTVCGALHDEGLRTRRFSDLLTGDTIGTE